MKVLQLFSCIFCSLGGPLRVRGGENQQYIAVKQVFGAKGIYNSI